MIAGCATPAVALLVVCLAGVHALPRPGVATNGAAANAGAGAFSSTGTAIYPGHDGVGSFNARANLLRNPQQGYGYGGGSYAGGGSYSGGGSYGGGGYGGGGYGGSFSGTGFPGQFPAFPFGPVPNPYSYQPNFDFLSFVQNYIGSIQQYHDKLAAQAQQQAASHGSSGSQAFPDSSTNEVGGPAGAAAVGHYSPEGGYGAASVFPAPVDGIDERFGGGAAGAAVPAAGSRPVTSVSGTFPQPNGSFYGVSSFSSSSQSDIDGKKTSNKQSSVSVNDNGKVTTYTAHDP